MYKFDIENHIHLLDEKPLMGTSTIVGILAKPLTWWASGMAVGYLGWTNSKLRVDGKYKVIKDEERLKVSTPVFERIKDMSSTDYLKFLDAAYKAHSVKLEESADSGTDRHALLEGYVKDCMRIDEGVPQDSTVEEIKPFVEWAKKNVKRFLWSELYGYSKELWTGGIADVGWIDMEDRVVAGDFKSSKEAYFNQFVQVAGYDLMISANGGYTLDGQKIFSLDKPIQAYCVVPFGMKELEPKIIYDVETYREAFKSAVCLYKLNQNYNG